MWRTILEIVQHLKQGMLSHLLWSETISFLGLKTWEFLPINIFKSSSNQILHLGRLETPLFVCEGYILQTYDLSNFNLFCFSRFLSVYVNIGMFMCVYVYICTCAYMGIYVYVHMRICARLYVCEYFHRCKYAFCFHPIVMKLETLQKSIYWDFDSTEFVVGFN